MNKTRLKNKVHFFLGMSEMARWDIEQIKKLYPFAVELNDKETDTQGYMLPYGTSTIIGFRGTQQLRDWLTDLDGFHTVYPYNNEDSKIQVHKGFIKAYRSVRSEIHAYMKKYKPKYISVCGHSLGGSLATLCAVDLQYNFPNTEIECFPSGNPRVGNKAFVKSYEKRVPNTLRTYMRTDLVPHMPPYFIEKHSKGGYKHCGIKNPIGPRNVLIGIINWFKNRFKTVNFAAELTNHSMKLYKKYS